MCRNVAADMLGKRSGAFRSVSRSNPRTLARLSLSRQISPLSASSTKVVFENRVRIFGNSEFLVSKLRGRLSPNVVQRLETVGDIAVRLRDNPPGH